VNDEEEEGNGEPTPPLEPRRHELLAAAVGEDNAPAAAVSTHMNFENRREFFFSSEGSVPQRRPSTCDAPKYYGPFIGECSRCSSSISCKQRGGRNADVQSKGRHSDNAFRLDPGHCHHLSNPYVLIAYNKWATNQSTGKKALYWAFYDELKVSVGKYPSGRVVGRSSPRHVKGRTQGSMSAGDRTVRDRAL